MKSLGILLVLAISGVSSGESVVVADTKHNQVEQMEDGETKLIEELAVRISESDSMKIDFSKLPEDKLEELSDSNVIHVSTPRNEVFQAKWDPKESTVELSPANLKSVPPGKVFGGFRKGVHVVAAGTSSARGFSVPWMILLDVAEAEGKDEKPGADDPPAVSSGSQWTGSQEP